MSDVLAGTELHVHVHVYVHVCNVHVHDQVADDEALAQCCVLPVLGTDLRQVHI